MGWVAIAAAVVSTAMSASAQAQSADAQQNAATYQAAVAGNNQIIARQNADLERQKGQQLETAQRQKTAQIIAMQRARGAASGVDIAGGNALRLQTDTAELGELDALTIRNNAARAAYGFELQGAGYAGGEALARAQADAAGTAGTIGVGSSIIGGAASVADKWLRYKNAGVDMSYPGSGGGSDTGGGWIDAGSSSGTFG